MKHIVSYSGGLSSFATARRVIAQYGTADVELLFLDTMTEDEDLYRFLDETEACLGVPLHRIADGRTVWDVFRDERYMGNTRLDPCSKILKRHLARTWIRDRYAPDACTLYLGLGWDERHRLAPVQKHWAPYRVEAPLMQRPYLCRDDIIRDLKYLGITPPRLYALGFAHNNCGGFCVKAGQAQFKLLYQTFPERYAYHEAQQEALFAQIGEHPFLRMTVDGTLRYLSLREFRGYLENQGQIDAFEWGGCGCFI